jgi:CheY-like chemotaxis protein/two-component sensor histidine kinase
MVSGLAVMQATEQKEQVYERSLQAVRRQTQHLARLLDDLLDVARITRGDIELQRVSVDMRSVIELGMENQRYRIDAKGQRLSVSMPDHPIRVIGDAVRLQQVFGNILHNASKYTQEGGAISVNLNADSERAVVTVRDDGVGIAPDRLHWIFEMFHQGNVSLARTEGGLGIGLTVAKRLMRLHGGDVRASSHGLGLGSQFTIELPLANQPDVQAPASTSDVSMTSKRVLVIEDNEDGREMLVNALRLVGHQVQSASTGFEGIEKAIHLAPDVVLVDIGLPDIQGYQVARELRSRLSPNTRLVAVTGYGGAAERARSAEVGFDAHLLKPVEPRTLLSTLQGLE